MIRKLMIIIMGIFLVICAGACNIYPLYLKTIMTKFNFTLKEVNLYGTFINLGHWVAFPMGWIYDTYGPKISCFIGCLFLSGSYFVLYLVLNSEIISISVVPFLLIALIMGQGSALLYTTAVTTNLKNFRFKASSAIVGLLTAHLALSPSVFTTYREAMKEIKISKYFIVIAIFIIAVVSVCVLVFRNIKRIYNEDEEKKTYQKYKERKIVKLLIMLSIVILVVYTFGIVFNSAMKSGELNNDGSANENKFPLVIVYPCLQLFNFVVVILEIYGVFDKLYFKPYIDKMIIKELTQKQLIDLRKDLAEKELRDANVNQLNVDGDVREIRENDSKRDGDYGDQENEIQSDIKHDLKEVKVSDVKQQEKIFDDYKNKLGFVELEMNVSRIKETNNKGVEKIVSNFKEIDNNKESSSNINAEYINKSEKDNENNGIISDQNQINDMKRATESLSSNLDNEFEIAQKKDSAPNIVNRIISENKEKILLFDLQKDGNNQTEEADRSISFKQAVMSKNVIILFFVLIFGVGSAIANLNNIEFIITSISAHSSSSYVNNHLTITNNFTNITANSTDIVVSNTQINITNTDITPTSTVNPLNQKGSATNIIIYSYVILYFVFNAFTKIITGIVLDYLLKIKKFFYYPLFISLIGLISQFIGIFLNKQGMLVSISLAGMVHGGYATFAPVFVRNEFGLTHMGKILGLLTSGCAIGSLLIADFVFIISYDYYSISGECVGTKCFRSSYIVTTIFFILNLVLSGILLRDYLEFIKKKKSTNGEITKNLTKAVL